jgi:subtilisin family serine protease
MRARSRFIVVLIVCFCSPILYLIFGRFDTNEVIVAVLDTGIDSNHPWLQGRVVNGFDFADWDTDTSDPDGHGTHVAGIIASEAPDAVLLSVRVITEEDDVRNTPWAILYAVLRGADVINMSFIEPRNVLTEWAITYGRFKGVVFVASSGNHGRDRVSYPSRYAGVYSIAAFDPVRQRVVGNLDDKVRFIAPGVNIESASLNGGTAKKSGTSMSAGYISGVIAYLKTVIPDLKPEELDFYLERASTEFHVSQARTANQGLTLRLVDIEQARSGLLNGTPKDENLFSVL